MDWVKWMRWKSARSQQAKMSNDAVTFVTLTFERSRPACLLRTASKANQQGEGKLLDFTSPKLPFILAQTCESIERNQRSLQYHHASSFPPSRKLQLQAAAPSCKLFNTHCEDPETHAT